jgi:hypothetical protein
MIRDPETVEAGTLGTLYEEAKGIAKKLLALWPGEMGD